MSLRQITLLTLVLLPFVAISQAPITFTRGFNVPVHENGNELEHAWAGGLNSCIFSEVDLNLDGIKDLFVYERSGQMVLPFLNGGTPGQVDYTYAPQYAWRFPKISGWGQMVDYNCDGKNDLMTYEFGSVKVFENTSNAVDGLQFELRYGGLTSYDDYFQSNTTVYSSSASKPSFVDVDGDGDLDILGIFFNTGNHVAYYENRSMEDFNRCDTLVFETRNHCWGFFGISTTANTIMFPDMCAGNVSNPRFQRDGSMAFLAYDHENDGDQDLLIGHDHFSDLTLATNGGSPLLSGMIAQENNFPSNSTPVDMLTFPTPSLLDVNNDGKQDLLVSPFYTLTSENFESVWHYENTAASGQHFFENPEFNFLQGDMIEVGEGSAPILFDANADGLMDMIVSNHDYYQTGMPDDPSQLALYVNTGTAQQPEFTLRTRDYNQLVGVAGLGQSLYPTFGDLNDDGDLDMIIGNEEGNLFFYENTASPNDSATFILSQSLLTDIDDTIIDVGFNARPFLYDLDGDGDQDLLIGARTGRLVYYRNVGDAMVHSFKWVTDTMGGVNTAAWWSTQGYSQPYVFEYDNDLWLAAGSNTGQIHLYNGVSDDESQSYMLIDTFVQNIYESVRTSIAMGDLNQDGKPEMLIGSMRGGISWFYGGEYDAINEAPVKVNWALYPNPASEAFQVRLPAEFQGKSVQWYLTDVAGRISKHGNWRGATTEINLGDLPSGCYFFNWEADGVSDTRVVLRP